MSVVITRLCRDCVDGACVDVCPVDCIVQEKPDAGLGLPNQLFINPDDCIDCGGCAPACPWEAIFEEDDVPSEYFEDIALNALTMKHPKAFHVPVERLRAHPTESEVWQNREKWSPAAVR